MKSILQVRTLVLGFVLTSGSIAQSLAQDAAPNTPAQIKFFENQIRPVLVENCYACHSQETESNGDLLLDTRSGMLRGGVSGPAVVPGNPERSLLITAVRYHDPDFAMPPKESGGKLPVAVIADLERWVKMGAPDPRDGVGLRQINGMDFQPDKGGIDRPETYPTLNDKKAYSAEAAKSWWAYQPITAPKIPAVQNRDWPLTEIDHFILAELEKQSLRPVASADKATLLRRVFIDLIGLPPTPKLQAQFLASNNPDALENVVDWLLKQPQFGQRWGRHWLDVARFAETTGKDMNLTMPEAWRYRDYVVDSFNNDKPFDQFIVEQIAGDLLRSSGDAERVEKLVATGFLAVGPKGLNETDPRQFSVDLADEQIDAVSQVFLGMTVSCARCHDHKFDPITQVDYTAMAGIFLSTQTHFGTPGGVRGRNASDLIEVPASLKLDTLGRRMDPKEYADKKIQLEAITKRRDEALRSRATQRSGTGFQTVPPQTTGRMPIPRTGVQPRDDKVSGFDIVRMITRAKQLEVELSSFNPDGTAKPMVMGVSDKPTRVTNSNRGPGRRGGAVGGPNTRGRTSSGFETIADSPLMLRGSIENESDQVTRGVPEFLAHGTKPRIKSDESGRLALANWIVSADNTLTSRVIVNRVWHWLFGRGLVESVDNFGASGTPPSNQPLLDHLASRFAQEGWSIKRLIREIVLSRVYQLESRYDASNHAIDPDNRFCWRANGRRLDAESIRDCVLAASNGLDSDPVPGSMIARSGDGPLGGQRFQAITEEKITAASGSFRSLYLPIARSVQPESLSIFDFTDPNIVLGSRDTTIVPPQALYLLNGAFMDQQAKAMAKRVMSVDGFEDRFTLACQLAYCRKPYADEITAAKKLRGEDLAAWTSICRALLSSADFLFIN